MNILVTGVTSFVGRALVKELIAEGYDVYGVIRPDSKNKRNLPRKMHIVTCDMSEADTMEDMNLPPTPKKVLSNKELNDIDESKLTDENKKLLSNTIKDYSFINKNYDGLLKLLEKSLFYERFNIARKVDFYNE